MIAIDSEKAQQLKTVGWVSYLLHLVVAVGAIIPGAQAGAVLLLLIALVIDLVKKDDAQGTWQASHFSWRPRGRQRRDPQAGGALGPLWGRAC